MDIFQRSVRLNDPGVDTGLDEREPSRSTTRQQPLPDLFANDDIPESISTGWGIFYEATVARALFGRRFSVSIGTTFHKQVRSDNDASESGILGQFGTIRDNSEDFLTSLEYLDCFPSHFRPFSPIIGSDIFRHF